VSAGADARRPALDGVGRAVGVAAVGGASAFLWLAIGCQLLAILTFFLTGTRDLVTWAKVGLLETVLSLRSAVELRLPGLPIPGEERVPTRPIEVSLVFVPMMLTVAFVWLCARAGRRAVDQRASLNPWPTVALAAAGAGAPVALLAALAAVPVRLSLPVASARIVAAPASAAVWGFVLAAAATGLGAAIRRASRSTVGRALRGGLIAYGWALLLLVVGVLAIAAFEPGATRAYVRWLGDTGPIAPAVFGVHVLALPAQSALLMAPASGACIDLLAGSPALELCPWRLDPSAIGASLVPARTLLSPGLWLLSTVPPIAALIGGRRAALAVAGRRAIGLGAASGLVFAVLAILGAWFATPSLGGSAPAFVPLTLRIGWPWFVAGAIAWGLLGGAVGGWLDGRRYAEEPEPPRRTSV
jgi:hypothetical protein